MRGKQGVNKVLFSGDGREGLTILNILLRGAPKRDGHFSVCFVDSR